MNADLQVFNAREQEVNMRMQGIFDLLLGVLGIVILIAVLTGGFEFEYGWIGYVAAALMIMWGIKAIITKSYKRQK